MNIGFSGRSPNAAGSIVKNRLRWFILTVAVVLGIGGGVVLPNTAGSMWIISSLPIPRHGSVPLVRPAEPQPQSPAPRGLSMNTPTGTVSTAG